METKEVQKLEEIQTEEINKRDEHKQLIETINILREKLIKSSGDTKN